MDGSLGVPGMVGDLLVGDRSSALQRAFGQRRVLVACRASLARSKCLEQLSKKELELELTKEGAILRAAGAFLLRLSRQTAWVVQGFKLEPRGLGALMSLPDEAVLCQQLQAVADAESETLESGREMH